MATKRAAARSQTGVVEAQFARVANQGSARHPQLAALLASSGPTSARDLADAVHLLCHCHGSHPGLIDTAVQAGTAGGAAGWLRDAADAFERERLYLVRLTAAVGPQPSTSGAAETEAALLAQRHPSERALIARQERAVEKLRRIDELLMRYDRELEWNADDASIDAIALLEGALTPKPEKRRDDDFPRR